MIEIKKANKTALIFGATGLVGSHVLKNCLASEAYTKVVAFTRRPLSISDAKLENPIVDFDRLSDVAHLIKGDDLFLCLGTTMKKAGSKEAFVKVDYDYQLAAAKFAEANGVNQVMLCSAVDAAADSRIFYNQVKGRLEADLKRMNFGNVHIFQPSLLMGERNENRLGENAAKVVGRFLDKMVGGLLSKYRPVEGEVVGAAMVKAAQLLRGGVHVYPSHLLSGIE
jgi:uncharacterized protein YbjT (DUF2867 family)